MSKCHICKEISCGDDNHTKSKIVKERNIGDTNKNLLKLFYQYAFDHGLQKEEFFGMASAIWDVHIVEEDLYEL